MTIKDLIEKNFFQVVNLGDSIDTEIVKPFCCDLLSIAIAKSQQGVIWFTVMGNINTIAVAVLTDVSCIVLSEGAKIDDVALEKAKISGITILSTEEPEFESAMKVMECIKCSS